MVAGMNIDPIVHNSGGIPGHEQMLIFLQRAGIEPRFGYVGFSVLYSGSKGGVGGTSRSQNNQHFRNWSNFGKDAAFADFHKRNRDEGPAIASAPNFHDVTIPSTGELPAQWREQIKGFLMRELGSRWVNTLTLAFEVANATNAPVPPPPPPAPRRK